jgi:Holliday junction resolvase RusA-like endonuclease
VGHDQRILTFDVTGKPVTQGSKQYMGRGRMLEVNDASLKAWRSDIKRMAYDRMMTYDGGWTLDGAFSVSMIFRFARPQGHYGAKGLRPSAPRYMTTRKGDVDKLSRAVLDALTTTLYLDDAQVVSIQADRRYAVMPQELPGVNITVIHLGS